MIWDKKINDNPKYFMKTIMKIEKKIHLYYTIYDVTKGVYYHAWRNAVYGGNPILLSQINF